MKRAVEGTAPASTNFKKYKLVESQQSSAGNSMQQQQQLTPLATAFVGEQWIAEGVHPALRDRAQKIYNAVKDQLSLDMQTLLVKYRAPPMQVVE